jgi:RND superfamily putative drug exporter
MFRWLGDFASRHRIAIIVGWIVAAALLIATAPPLDEVSSTDQRDFLPADAPFAQAQAVFERTFPAEFSASSTVILVDAGEGGDVHDPAIWDYVGQVEAYLNSPAAPENISEVAAPTTDPLLADVLISSDKRLALISARITTPTDAAITTHAVTAIDDWLEENPPQGFTVYQTGEAGLNAQAEESTFTTMDRTLLLTFALVIVALLLIYRSPVSPLIPLVSVTIAFIASVGIISHLARLDVINVIAQVNALLVVVMYGAGTDYNLFLISRFREELADSIGVQKATRRAVRLVGETITSSAGTVFVGFMAMVFAEIGMIKSAGPMLAIGIAISLLAGLTLTPALLATLGERAFWPAKASHRSTGRFYEVTSKLVSGRPLLTIVVIVALMIPFSVYGLARDLNYDFVSELPKTIDSVKAYDLLRDQMGGGSLFPLSVIVTGRDAAAVPAEIEQLSAELAAIPGVTDLRSLDMPLGLHNERIANLLRVDGQLNMLANLASEDAGVSLQGAADVVSSIQRYMALLVERFPEIADDPNYTLARSIVDGGLLQIALRQGELMDAVRGLAQRFAQMDNAEMMPPVGEGDLFADLQPLAASYLAEGGTAYRIDVILNDPLSDQGQAAVMAVRDLLRRYDAPSGEAVVSGFPAVMTDLHNVMKGDIIRTGGFIMGGIFLVLLVMLRSAIAPLYLIATVLLSFTCTLGITGLFFQVVFGVERLSWLLPIFMLGFLVGLGIDYSIFLFGRIKEEVAYHGVREGVHMAVAKTGAIITSAAIILAGTFAGMITGEIAFLAQMGFAVSVGVLLDAFIVRTMLDPALAALFGKWTWWPGGVPKPETDPARVLAPAAEMRA